MIGFTQKWNDYLQSISTEKKDIYFSEEYLKLYETETEKAFCFVYQENENTFLFPYLRREFLYKDKVLYDFETAYGYGGPVCSTGEESFLLRAYERMRLEAEANGYVCGFVRFHPLLDNCKCFDTIGRVIQDRKTVAIDLHGTIDEVWMNEIHTKNRNVIKKGSKSGLTFIADNDYKYLPEFIELYNSTMDKLSADGFYYFPSSYYEMLKTTLKNSFLGVVLYEKKVVASAIFFYQSPYGHYHLAGSDKNCLKLSPNNYLLWEAAKEMHKRGVEYFHLGGGTDGTDENSLFQYKRRFSKSDYQFSLGKIVFNQVVYEQLCQEWELQNPDKVDKMRYILLKYKY